MSDSSNEIPTEWYFITAPQTVSWSKESASSEIETYGTNNPYFNYGTTKLRKLSLGQAMVEGFSDGKNVEDNIVQLEACMRMVIQEDGFASPYCWKVYAGDKSYGTFIITSVSVQETMRDMAGDATRAFVGIELQEVSPYQVTSGIDITSQATVGGISKDAEAALLKADAEATKTAAKQDAKVAKTKADTKAAASASSAGTTGTSNATTSQSAAAATQSSGSSTAKQPAGVGAVDPKSQYQVK